MGFAKPAEEREGQGVEGQQRGGLGKGGLLTAASCRIAFEKK